NYVDNLRGIAILLVVITHISDVTRHYKDTLQVLTDYGQMGVQLFFVASAFTLCLSAGRRAGEDRAWTRFYLRRFFRIAPLYYSGILLYLLFCSTVRPWLEGAPAALATPYTWKNILANVLLVHDFYPGQANNKVVPGGWSIGTETTFYLIFPLIYLLYRRVRHSDALLVLIPASALLAGYLFLPLAERLLDYPIKNNTFLYFHLYCQLPVFLMGMSLYFKLERLQHAGRSTLLFSAAAFVLLLAGSIYLFTYRPDLTYLFPSSAGLAFLFLFLLYRELPFLSNRYIGRLGTISYSVYLLHFMFAWDGTRFLFRHLHPAVSRELLFLAGFSLTMVLTIPLALFTEKYIEKPGIAFGNKIIRRLKKRKPRMIQPALPEPLKESA
ncbi:MAG TPA: acyltransferase, partial [Chitinophagaceae bacterium]|nr:acyltransferase [Chitinophagaceae bacterium]